MYAEILCALSTLREMVSSTFSAGFDIAVMILFVTYRSVCAMYASDDRTLAMMPVITSWFGLHLQ
jgi:hypothetical protein